MGAQAVVFLAGFLIVLGLYIALIRFTARRLSDRIPQAQFAIVERTLIGGIIAGVIGMFQPWFFRAYTVGFLVLLFSTLAFILWSHITPAPPKYESAE
jgi:hypothetical protein